MCRPRRLEKWLSKQHAVSRTWSLRQDVSLTKFSQNSGLKSFDGHPAECSPQASFQQKKSTLTIPSQRIANLLWSWGTGTSTSCQTSLVQEHHEIVCKYCIWLSPSDSWPPNHLHKPQYCWCHWCCCSDGEKTGAAQTCIEDRFIFHWLHRCLLSS